LADREAGGLKDLPGIPKEEYPQRLERLRRLMRHAGMEAVFLGTGNNLAYFSAYPSPARSVARPFFVLLPLAGDPVFFSHSGHRAEAVRFSWIGDVREYSELSRVPSELIRDAMRERGIFGKTVGMELGFEQAMDISWLEFQRFQSTLGITKLVDASTALWRLRMVKSAREITCIRKACEITSEAYRICFLTAREGMQEQEVFRATYNHLQSESMGDVFLAITSGDGNYDLVTKPPESRPLCKGDFVWLDAGCTVSGYWSDFSRAGVVGEPSPEQQHAQETIHQITTEAVNMVRPGVAASALAKFCYQRLSELDFPITSSITTLAGRVGHGVGLNMTEPPHISGRNHTALAPGMVITIEPGVATSYGTFHVEENVLVTEDGFEVLSNSPRDLRCIAQG
jgi:Xaa-Pro aminopeptidase